LIVGKFFYRIVFLFIAVSTTGFSQSNKHCGVCWVGGREVVTDKEITGLVNNHINWISQTPFGWMQDAGSSSIIFHTQSNRIWWGESDEGIATTTRLARQQGVKTLLKPHLWIRQGWPGDVQMKSDTAWQKWFSNYEKFILHYAALAEKSHIEILCIGTELQQTTPREREWRMLIAKIRKVYKGRLIYAANFHEEFERIRFWDALDYIGIQAYFPLAKNPHAPVSELVKNWEGPVAAIEKIHAKFNKPVIFTEIGYRSDADAAVEPWRWPQHTEGVTVSNQAQSNCYEAFFRAVWNKPWLAGAYFWKWYPHGPHRQPEIDFTPQGKPAEKIMAENFKKAK
jgi:hypothetical protein